MIGTISLNRRIRDLVCFGRGEDPFGDDAVDRDWNVVRPGLLSSAEHTDWAREIISSKEARPHGGCL